MSNTSKKSIARNRPARRARRGAESAAPEAPASQTGESAPSQADVAQLAFQFFADSGFVHGNALDHWLRAESELVHQS